MNNMTISFPLNTYEYESLWLHLDKEARTKELWLTIHAYPETRTEQTMQVIKSCCMIDMNLEKTAWQANIAKRTLVYLRWEYGKRSEALCTLMELRSDNVEVVAKTGMLWLLAKWHAQTIMDVVKTKDKRYREANNEVMQSLAQYLGLVSWMTQDAQDFIISRKWTSPSQDSQQNKSITQKQS